METEEFALVIAVVATIFAALSAFASLAQTIVMRREYDRREQPFITGHFQGSNSGAVYFVLENRGNAPAINTKVKFDPAPNMHNGVSLNDVSLFNNPILFFPPGESYRQLIDLGWKMLADGQPTIFELNLSYQTPSKREITNQIKYNLDYLKNVLRPNATIDESLQKIAEHLEKIYDLQHRTDEHRRMENWAANQDDD